MDVRALFLTSFLTSVLSLVLSPGWLAAAAVDDPNAILVDEVIRYINGEPITNNEVRRRVQLYEQRLLARGQLPQASLELRQQLMQQALAEITSERLLLDEAERLQIPDEDHYILREVQQEALQQGKWPTLVEQREEFNRRRDHRRQLMVERYYFERLPEISPASVREAYQKRQADFTRPPRARIWRLLVIPDGPEVEDQLADRMVDLIFQKAAVDPLLAISALVTDELRLAYADAADAAAQIALFEPVLRQIQALAPADPEAPTAQLLEQTARLLRQRQELRDPASAEAQLRSLRDELQQIETPAARLAAFRLSATRLGSIPSEAASGGDLGMLEAGALGPDYEQLFSLEEGAISQVFAVGEAYCLALVSERVPAQTKSLAEVSVAIRSRLRDRQEEEARRRLLGQLLARGLIHDVHALDVDRMLGRGSAKVAPAAKPER